MTQQPRIRRDPRDLASSRVRAPAARPTPSSQENFDFVRVDHPACYVLAVIDLEAGRLSRADSEVMRAARQLADTLGGAVTMVACSASSAEFRARPAEEGADRLALFTGSAFDLAEDRLPGVLATAHACDARHLVFPETALGGELARRLAARWGERPAIGVRGLSASEVVCQADAGRMETTRPTPRILVLAPEAFETVVAPPRREARQLAISCWPNPANVRMIGTVPLDPAAIPLAEADLIISAGSGVTDWASFHRAATVLGAAEAGSRVVCDAGLLHRSRQVGASGTLVAPRCYLAFGIAGALQHLQGVEGAQCVIAVNTDPRAEIMKRADLAIVADAQAVLPALVRRITERRNAA